MLFIIPIVMPVFAFYMSKKIIKDMTFTQVAQVSLEHQ